MIVRRGAESGYFNWNLRALVRVQPPASAGVAQLVERKCKGRPRQFPAALQNLCGMVQVAVYFFA